MVSSEHRPAWIPTPPLTSHKGGQGVRERVTPGGTGAGPPQGWSLGARGPGMQGLGLEVQTGMVGVDQAQLPMPGMPGMRDGSDCHFPTVSPLWTPKIIFHWTQNVPPSSMALPPALSRGPCPRHQVASQLPCQQHPDKALVHWALGEHACQGTPCS